MDNAEIKIPESAILRQICQYLKIRNHQWHRLNNMGVYDGKKDIYRRNKNTMKGLPDILVYMPGKLIALEVKSKTGTVSIFQATYKMMFESAGGKYYVVRSVEDVQGIGL